LSDAQELVRRLTRPEDLLCATICGEALVSKEEDFEQLVEAAFRHGLHLVLFETIKAISAYSLWPLRFRQKLEAQARIASCLDLINEQEINTVLSRLYNFGVQSLLLKGAPLSYTLYKSSMLRPRGDVDLLVQQDDLDKVEKVLTECGYDAAGAQDNNASYQRFYSRKDSFGIYHCLDLHWKVNNAPLFADTLTFDELHAEAIPITALGPHALGLGHVHALLLACMHRFAHAHAPFYAGRNKLYAGDHLLWLYAQCKHCKQLHMAEQRVPKD
jgi:hypothetical protein